jgi:hypothetical protein
MQPDFFESTIVSEMKALRDRRDQLREELDQVNYQILSKARALEDIQIADNLWMGRHLKGQFILFSKKLTGGIDSFFIVSVDNIVRAIRQLTQENHDAPKGISGSHGGQAPQSPW